MGIMSNVTPWERKGQSLLYRHVESKESRKDERAVPSSRVLPQSKGSLVRLAIVSRDEKRRIVDGTGWTVRKLIEPEGAQYVAVLEKSTARGNIP